MIQKITYNVSTNTFIGFSTPLEHGIPIFQYFQTDSYEQLQEWFENNDKSNLLNVHMLELLPTSKSSSSPFLLGAYGITNKFDAIDVLHRWMWRRIGISVHEFFVPDRKEMCQFVDLAAQKIWT